MDIDTLLADLARVTAERDATRAELMRQIAERDALREALATQAAAVRQLDVARTARHDADARDAETLRRRQQAPGDVLAEIAAVREEARMWNARATELEGERDALRAIVEGRTVAPTVAEARAVREAGGAFVRSPVYLDGFCGRFAEVVTGLARLGSESEDQRRALARWFVIDHDGRPCAWPVVEVSRG